MMKYFSVAQSRHLLVAGEKEGARASLDQVTVGWMPSSFSSQMSWDNLEEFLFPSWVKSHICPYSLSLNVLLVIPV